MKKKQILIIMITCLASYCGQSQVAQIINTSGGSVAQSGYTVEWSIGELALVSQMVAADNSYILTNGFIQPYPDKPGHPANILSTPATVAVFPNPTEDYVTVTIKEIYSGRVSLKLYNELGQIVYQDETLVHGFGFIHKINMKTLKNGTYTLYLASQNPLSNYEITSKSFKIIKQ